MELDVREVATLLQVPESTVFRLIDEENLPTTRVNGKHRFSRLELFEWANVHRDNCMRLIPPAQSDAPADLGTALEHGGMLSGITGTDRASALEQIVGQLPLPSGADREELLQLLLARETAGTTAIGNGIAIPHARCPMVLPVGEPLVSVCYLEHPIDFGAADGKRVDTLFVLMTPTIPMHLQILARVATLVRNPTVVKLLRERASIDKLVHEARRIAAPARPAAHGEA